MSLPLLTCEHRQQISYCKYTNCVLCGAIVSQAENTQKPSDPNVNSGVVKDDQFNSRADVSTSQIYSTMLNDQYVTHFYNPTAQFLKVRLVAMIL